MHTQRRSTTSTTFHQPKSRLADNYFIVLILVCNIHIELACSPTNIQPCFVNSSNNRSIPFGRPATRATCNQRPAAAFRFVSLNFMHQPSHLMRFLSITCLCHFLPLPIYILLFLFLTFTHTFCRNRVNFRKSLKWQKQRQ